MKYNNKGKISNYIELLILFIELDAFIYILFELNYAFRPFVFKVTQVIIIAIVFELVIKFFLSMNAISYIKRYWHQYVILGILLVAYYRFKRVSPDSRFLFIYSRIFLSGVEILIFVKFILQFDRLKEVFSAFNVSPAQMIIVSFATIILIGSFLLYLPYSHVEGSTMRYIDSVFTSTSAVCVTGLIVVDTGSAFSLIGKIFLLLLIQAGGIGIMTIAAFIQVSLGSEMSLYSRFSTASLLDQSNLRNLYALIKSIIAITFVFEFIGVVLFFPYFYKSLDNGLKALFYSIFHSVSAFCNAGFSLYSNSFMDAKSNIWVNVVLIFLIVCGGLGFTVILNLTGKIFKAEKERLTVQTRIVLLTTAFFICYGAISFYLLEQNNILNGLNPKERFLTSIFQSITTRTAGFNTVDISRLRPITLFMMTNMMFVGASPGSTGGGIKTTTFFILLLSIITILRDQRFNTIFGRRIPFQIINRTFAILVSSIILVIMGTLFLGFTEGFSFIRIFFETVSAFGTVGLSTGITSSLSDFGKIVIIICMFAGRIGPLTLVLAIKNKQRTRLVTYPEERVMVG